MWTSRIGTWWPADHTVTGDRDLAIVLESGVGGRIYERTAHGVEHDWGVVTVWGPPKRLADLWAPGGGTPGRNGGRVGRPQQGRVGDPSAALRGSNPQRRSLMAAGLKEDQIG